MEQQLNRTLTLEEKAEIFELVNAEHLRLTGNKKKATKSNFKKVWKSDNMAYQLMIALYDSEDKYDDKNEWFKEYISEESAEAYKNKKSVPYAKHVRTIHRRNEEIEDLDNKLDNVLEDNKLMSKADHEDEIKQLKRDNKEQVLQLEDEIQNLKNKLKYAEQDAQSKINIQTDKAKYYEEQLNIIVDGNKDKNKD